MTVFPAVYTLDSETPGMMIFFSVDSNSSHDLSVCWLSTCLNPTKYKLTSCLVYFAEPIVSKYQ